MGGLTPDLESRQDLFDFINELVLLDVDLQGGLFTWSHRRVGRDYIHVFLDRAFISLEWMSSYNCNLSLMARSGSYHSHISLTLDPIDIK